MTVDRDRVRGWLARLGGVYGWVEDPDRDAAIDRLIAAGMERVFAWMRVMDDRRAAAVAEMRSAGADAVFPVLTEFLTRGEPNEALGAVEAALLTDRERGVEFVLPLLRSEDGTMRWTVCGHLMDHGDARAVPALRDATRDADPGVRGIAVTALGRCGGPAVIPDLVAALDDHEEDQLGHTPSSAAVFALDGILCDLDPRVKDEGDGLPFAWPRDLDRLRRQAEAAHRKWAAGANPSKSPETP